MLNEDSDLPVYSSRENLHVREESREYSSRVERVDIESSVNKQLTVNRGSSIESSVTGGEELRGLLLRETDVLGLRLPLLYVSLYRNRVARDRRKIRALKEAICSIIRALSETELPPVNDPPHINLNLNLVVNEVKAEAKVEDPSRLLERLAFLEEDVKFYKAKLREREEMLKFYKERCERLQRDLERLRSAARRRDWTSVMRLLGV